jgi:ubiquinone biosynthesis protein
MGDIRAQSEVSLGQALVTEGARVAAALVRYSFLTVPRILVDSLRKDPMVDSLFTRDRRRELLGQGIMSLFNDLGPLYGKAGQVLVSRAQGDFFAALESLDMGRLFGDWLPMDFAEVSAILDQEIPQWRGELVVDPDPIGVASMAQVHSATDASGRKWVLKILKPHACVRLLEGLAVLDGALDLASPFAVTAAADTALRNLRSLSRSLAHECSLDQERATLRKVHAKMSERKQTVLALPKINENFSSNRVLVIEQFQGTLLKDIVRGRAEIPLAARKKLAKSLLRELLLQVFEMGLFHGDPHAGNLILLSDGRIGIFDWGLAGELFESDRKHIADILKAVMALDLDRLAEALYDLGRSGMGIHPSRTRIRSEMRVLTKKLARQEGQAPLTFCDQVEACLSTATKIGISLPDGLLLMAKSLITIEGLAKGIDPEVPMLRIASPLLLTAGRPGFRDLFTMAKNLPKIARRFVG